MPSLSRRTFLLSSVASGLTACTLESPLGHPATSDTATRGRQLYARIFEEMLVATPEMATNLGLDTGERAALKGRLSDASPAGKLSYYAAFARALPQLKAIRREELTGRDRG